MMDSFSSLYDSRYSFFIRFCGFVSLFLLICGVAMLFDLFIIYDTSMLHISWTELVGSDVGVALIFNPNYSQLSNHLRQ